MKTDKGNGACSAKRETKYHPASAYRKVMNKMEVSSAQLNAA